ncbi:leucyl-tRNA synthetase [Asanoa ferruginea]|uniref:Leucine--tRNA ligase n=1 Tax=Asanoa ferruginea TaxID=53367 RepID=A0A3D9ZZJ9_9ACTN|nr:leucine--tRNA ligase [Asanoa ferruginea]REG02115.1 leucyl-tRNA synthetase [Asanoa ferruginea]GIF48589.1 leucine--tRNA ligase [Asanoa ferruginea]
MSEAAERPEHDVPPFRYTAALAGDIEQRWQDYWEARGTFRAPNPVGELADPEHPRAGAPKIYVHDMFPYPSGEGLHVGHPLGYIGTDVYTRFKRMTGFNVLHPMGFDAFGLPAEQYAVQTGTHPRITTERNMVRFWAQLRRLGMGYDERRKIATSEPEFFRWTQWIFLQIFNSWYDTDAGRARPIDELVDQFAAGTRPTPDGRPWSELSGVERRAVLDEHRLAYVSEAPVNWCPGLGTVLANEEVTPDGRSERGNFPVFKRRLKQWMMRITAYADRLVDDLDTLDWPEPVKLMQRNWIGRSTGAHVDFPFETAAGAEGEITVFTTRPDTLFGATYMVVAPEHPIVDTLTARHWPEGTHEPWKGGYATPVQAVAEYRRAAARKTEVERAAETRDKTGVFTGTYAVNPVNGARVPVFIADYVLAGYGTGAIMAVPGQDERDWEFAEVFELPIIRTVRPTDGFDGKAFTGDGPAINSAAPDRGLVLDGLGVVEAKATMIAWLEAHGAGTGATTYRLRDWLFSRQRYWGEPFPIVYDETGLPVALPDSMLPVSLPEVDDFAPRTFDPDDADSNPETPLSRAREWVDVELDLGDGPKRYIRDTNTMPNWAGSCWYELRYLDPRNDKQPVDPENEAYWMGPRHEGDPGGVDLYVGGVEHAVLHLLYARFWHKILFDLGYVSSVEPFRRLFNQGYIQAYAFRDARGIIVPAEEVEERDGAWFHEGVEVKREYGKMGKSLKNVVTPDEMCEAYGADTFRVYEMAMGPLDVSRPWETRAVVGAQRFLQRVWRLVVDEETGATRVSSEPADEPTRRLLHRIIDGVRGDLDELRFNTGVAKLIELTNGLTALGGPAPREIVEPLVLMTAPFAPHVAEELWQRLGHPSSLAYADFPVADPALLVAEEVTYPVQVNGKVRGRVSVSADAADDEVRSAALSEVADVLGGKDPKKVIVVKGRMVSVVV